MEASLVTRTLPGYLWSRPMRRLVFLGSIVGTFAAFLAACLATLATLVWLLRVWYPAPWVIVLIAITMLVATVAVIWRWWHLPAEDRFRFSLRGMLISLTLFALWLGTVGVNLLQLGQQIAAVAEMAPCGVEVYQADMVVYEAEDAKWDWAQTRRLNSLLGYNPFVKVSEFDIRTDQGLPALLEHARFFPDLELINFVGSRVSDAGMERIAELRRFPKLRCVLFRCNITDSGLKRLADWKELEELDLFNCARITDAGMAHLKDLPNLRNMPNLRRVCLRGTAVTNPGVLALCQQLPDCFVGSEEAYCPAGACLSIRFEGQRRCVAEIGLGNGVYADEWNHYCPILPVHEQQIRDLLAIDLADWNTR